jgi:hypothetical protein
MHEAPRNGLLKQHIIPYAIANELQLQAISLREACDETARDTGGPVCAICGA